MTTEPIPTPLHPQCARVVLLGASNLTLGFHRAVASARATLGQPLDILAAHGHGRSFGINSTVLGRRLPGIVHSGLWEALGNRGPLPAYALITDVAYGVPVPTLVNWLKTCLDKLGEHSAHVVLTLPPIESLSKLPRFKFAVLRTLLFPRSGLKLQAVIKSLEQFTDETLRLADERQITVIKPEIEWYGFDPIHFRRRCRDEVWRRFLAPWSPGRPTDPSALATAQKTHALGRLAPAKRHLLGIAQVHSQPCCRLKDGTTVSLY